MTLRLKINLIVGALTILFVAAILALQLRSMRESVNEEVVAANRVATQLLQRNAWLYAAQGTPAMLAYLQGIGRVRSNEIVLYDEQGQELYRSPPSTYKAGRDAPDWFERLIAPEPSVVSVGLGVPTRSGDRQCYSIGRLPSMRWIRLTARSRRSAASWAICASPRRSMCGTRRSSASTS